MDKDEKRKRKEEQRKHDEYIQAEVRRAIEEGQAEEDLPKVDSMGYPKKDNDFLAWWRGASWFDVLIGVGYLVIVFIIWTVIRITADSILVGSIGAVVLGFAIIGFLLPSKDKENKPLPKE